MFHDFTKEYNDLFVSIQQSLTAAKPEIPSQSILLSFFNKVINSDEQKLIEQEMTLRNTFIKEMHEKIAKTYNNFSDCKNERYIIAYVLCLDIIITNENKFKANKLDQVFEQIKNKLLAVIERYDLTHPQTLGTDNANLQDALRLRCKVSTATQDVLYTLISERKRANRAIKKIGELEPFIFKFVNSDAELAPLLSKYKELVTKKCELEMEAAKSKDNSNNNDYAKNKMATDEISKINEDKINKLKQEIGKLYCSIYDNFAKEKHALLEFIFAWKELEIEHSVVANSDTNANENTALLKEKHKKLYKIYEQYKNSVEEAIKKTSELDQLAAALSIEDSSSKHEFSMGDIYNKNYQTDVLFTLWKKKFAQTADKNHSNDECDNNNSSEKTMCV